MRTNFTAIAVNALRQLNDAIRAVEYRRAQLRAACLLGTPEHFEARRLHKTLLARHKAIVDRMVRVNGWA